MPIDGVTPPIAPVPAASGPSRARHDDGFTPGGVTGALGGADTIGVTPGTRFRSLDDAARDVLRRANPLSVSDNLEFGGRLFQDPTNDRFGATAPARGSDTGFNLGTVGVPPGTRDAGNYHTHGDYSEADAAGNAVRTSDPRRDHFNSDDFSTQDHRVIGRMGAGKPDYAGYLGTPGGNQLKLDATTNTTTSLRPGVHGAASDAIVGAGASAAVTLLDAARSGHVGVNDLRHAAENGVAGAGLGVTASVVERSATHALDRVAGAGVERVASSALGAESALVARTAATRLGGAGAAGAVVSVGVSVYENRTGLLHGDAHAIGNVAGDAVVGTGSALAGAAAGAAIGSVVPVAGTLVGAGVGLVAGYAADKIMRAGGLDSFVGENVSDAVDAVKHVFGW